MAKADPSLLDRDGPTGPLLGYEGEWPRLRSLLARGDEASQRMGLYLADEAQKRSLYTDAMRDAIGANSTEADLRVLYGKCGSTDPLNRALFIDFETLLPDQVLPFVDRLSMAHSVEVRPPFLDHRLIEFAATLPGWIKIKQGRVKSVLKDAVSSLLPQGPVDRPKEGFVMPINEWLLQALRGYVTEMLSAARVARHGLLDSEAVANLMGRYYGGDLGLAGRIWNLVCFQMWWERYVMRTPA